MAVFVLGVWSSGKMEGCILGRSRMGLRTGWLRIMHSKDFRLLEVFKLSLYSCSFGEYVVPNKTLNSCDHYQGQWKDGKMHGFGTFRCVSFFLMFA